MLLFFFLFFVKCLVVWRVGIQGLIIDTECIEELLRKISPSCFFFMCRIPVSEVGVMET